MRANDARPIAAAVAATWLLLAAVPPGAATAAAPDVTNAADEAAPTTPGLPELLEATEADIREAMALESQVQAASGEQRDILVERGRVAWTSAGEKMRALLEEIARLREAGGDVGEAREEAAGFLDQLARWNARHVETLHAELKRLRAARDGASAEELPRIEEELTQTNAEYDRLLLVWVRQCEAREELGLDARAECARGDELLTARAEERSTQVLVTRKRILELTSKAAGADEEEAKRLRAEIASLEGRLGAQVESLRQLADLMDARGLATAEHRGLLIETTGEITTDILSQEVALGLVERWGTDAKRWLVARAPNLAFSAILAVALLLGAHLAGRLLQRVAKRALQSARVPVSQLFQSFVLTMTYRIALGLGALVVLSQLGVAIGPLLAGLGFASFIVGFALQDTLSNFAAGMLILAYRPFDVGDEITAGGVSGHVEQMTLVTTTILTNDHQRLIVPNNKIWGDVIIEPHGREHAPRRPHVRHRLFRRRRARGEGAAGHRCTSREGAEGSRAGDQAALARRVLGELHRATLGADRRLLGCLLGHHARGKAPLRCRGHLDPFPAARRASDPTGRERGQRSTGHLARGRIELTRSVRAARPRYDRGGDVG